MSDRQFKLVEMQQAIHQRRTALLADGVQLPSDDELRNKGGRRTEAKQQLLRRMEQSAKAAGKTPTRRYF